MDTDAVAALLNARRDAMQAIAMFHLFYTDTPHRQSVIKYRQFDTRNAVDQFLRSHTPHCLFHEMDDHLIEIVLDGSLRNPPACVIYNLLAKYRGSVYGPAEDRRVSFTADDFWDFVRELWTTAHDDC